MITKEIIGTLYKKYNIPEDTPYIKRASHYVVFHKIENNKLSTLWDVRLFDSTPKLSKFGVPLPPMSTIRQLPPISQTVFSFTVVMYHYRLVDNEYILHNENGYAIERYIDDKRDLCQYWINGKEITEELIEANPEILKDSNLRKILL